MREGRLLAVKCCVRHPRLRFKRVSPAGPKNSLAPLEKELQTERAGALSRIGDTLDRLIAETEALAHALPSAGEARERVLAEYERVRQEAETYRWYLIVTREAIGLRRHEDVYELYRVPKRLYP